MRTLAKLSHPHILTVYQAGVTNQGLPFLVTELIPGGSLAAKIGKQPQDPDASARLVLLLAKAVQAAHEAGILHRDLKPANVLLADAAGEPALNSAWGWPKLADFGLAKFLASDQPIATQAGRTMGSPPYMAPEQVAGDLERIGPATDVFGLGAILYELLTGQPPFQNLLRDKPVVPPLQLQPRLPSALAAICLKCLAHEPQNRYPSPGALADQLNAHLSGKSVADTNPAPVSRLSKKNALLAVVVAGTTVAALFLLGWQLSAYLGARPTVPGPLTTAPVTQIALSGELEVMLWSDADPSKRGVRVQTPGSLPARHRE